MIRSLVAVAMFGVVVAGPAPLPAADAAGEKAVAVLFANEPVDASTGVKVTQFWVAEDFQVNTSAAATSVSFKLGDWNGDFPAVFDGLIRWRIHLDDCAPGAVIALGTAQDVSYSVISPSGSAYTTCYEVSFNLGQQVQLTAGTRYWLALNVNLGLAYSELYSWLKCGTFAYAPAVFDDGVSGWTSSNIDLTFTVVANSEVDYLFADGFESANPDMWSASIP